MLVRKSDRCSCNGTQPGFRCPAAEKEGQKDCEKNDAKSRRCYEMRDSDEASLIAGKEESADKALDGHVGADLDWVGHAWHRIIDGSQ